MSKKRTKSLPPQQQVQQLPYTTTQSSPNNNNNTTRDVSTLSSSNIAASQVFMNTTHSPIVSSSSDQQLPSMIPSFSSPIPIQTITSNNTIGTGVTSPLGSSQQHASSSPRIHSLLNHHHHTSPRGGTVPPTTTTTTTLSNSSSSLSSSETPMIHSPLFMNQQQYLETNQIPSPQKSIHSFSQLQQQQQPSTTTSKNLTPPSAISSLSLDTILRNATNELKQLNSTLATAIPTKPLTFSDLPNDLLHYILCFLELKDFLSCRLTNRVFHILAENEWQRHYRAVWEVPHRLVFWDIDTPIVSSRQSFLIGAPILHSALTLTPQNM
ncbi:hypothetical protein C9374_000073 [Naegleria lovaniensis]|uniref:F-box domain-containing protein n=1 Tax=Naegleria lovaniensis TaxID=51637 RepID=A0AA88GZ36_NAELO|nr:uncharacterized protein C9374_000073 [Naegleria lovaniensis]KAG2388634.1 hypothetical protein C9374_000073 [Naegleria lovaniensis]